jgi:transcriptional regulator with XRE-family HTH domain
MTKNRLASTIHSPSRAGVAQILGRRVRYLRAQLGLTQQELAGRVQIDRSYVSRVERGLLLPRLATLVQLAASLNVSVSELVRGIPVSNINIGPLMR